MRLHILVGLSFPLPVQLVTNILDKLTLNPVEFQAIHIDHQYPIVAPPLCLDSVNVHRRLLVLSEWAFVGHFLLIFKYWPFLVTM